MMFKFEHSERALITLKIKPAFFMYDIQTFYVYLETDLLIELK